MFGGQATSGAGSKKGDNPDAPKEDYEKAYKANLEANDKERNEVSEKFQKSQSFKNLEAHIPGKIEVGDEEAPIMTNVELFKRIQTNVANLSLSEHAYDTALASYGKDIGLSQNVTALNNEKTKDFLIQKLAIAVSCHDSTIIHLNDSDRTKLTELLLPLVSDSKIHLTKPQEDNETIKENTEYTEYPGYPYIERMLKNGGINQEEFDQFITAFQEAGSIENIDTTNLASTIQEIIKTIQLDDENTQASSLKNFLNIFPEYEEQAKISPSLRIIGENFLDIPINKEGHLDNQANFKTAVEVASNKIRWHAKNFKTDTDEYKQAIRDTKSEKPDEMIHGIQTLFRLKGIGEGAPAEKTKKDYDAITKFLQKSHNRGVDGQKDKLAKIQDIRNAERADMNNDKQQDQLTNLSMPANSDYYEKASVTPLQSGNPETENISTTTSYQGQNQRT